MLMLTGGECVVCGSTVDPHQCLTEEEHRERAIRAFDVQGLIAKRAAQEGFVRGLERARELVDDWEGWEGFTEEHVSLLLRHLDKAIGDAQADLSVIP